MKGQDILYELKLFHKSGKNSGYPYKIIKELNCIHKSQFVFKKILNNDMYLYLMFINLTFNRIIMYVTY